MRPLVAYLIARDGPPPPAGVAYDYVLGGDGLWLAAQHDALAVRAPVARAAVRGLPPLGGACVLTHGPLPAACWDGVVRVARHFARHHLEVLLLATHGPRGYRLLVPRQRVTATRVYYEPPALAAGELVVLQIHSHHALAARFSAVDDRDEQGLGLYGVVGRLDGATPEVALRAGAYGAWLPVRWDAVFQGEIGPFRDLVAAACAGEMADDTALAMAEEEVGHGLPD
ncbi:MAG TPA: Mov34/MPN/PAD-1 family protein [Thermomicrobiales bacterium]|nr:Mov34/MPN/PAD-1 family protein [Thermomicrobiales bacterium]